MTPAGDTKWELSAVHNLLWSPSMGRGPKGQDYRNITTSAMSAVHQGHKETSRVRRDRAIPHDLF